jgi:hypothetical protein
MCRQTGVHGLNEILADIQLVQESNALAAEYLRGIILALIGTQAMVAARILKDEETADWKKKAAHSFLQDVCKAPLHQAIDEHSRWFVRTSWDQLALGIYCASLMLKELEQSESSWRVAFPPELLAIGKARLERSDSGGQTGSWVWWAARGTLRNVEPRPEGFVKSLAESMDFSPQAAAFWRFFPRDVPSGMLLNMAKGQKQSVDIGMLQGWWYDALRGRRDVDFAELQNRARMLSRVRLNLESKRRAGRISLYDWCERIADISRDNPADPRSGEWTALEIVRQIASLMVAEPLFDADYIKGARRGPIQLPCVHPANFQLPIEWLKGGEPRWEQWSALVRKGRGKDGVAMVPRVERIVDIRYTPLSRLSSLFTSVNPVRGLGLVLYGLLRKCFDLPALWNGPGHSDVLRMLPTLLLKEMTCSSWTLGVLQGCLQPRATENLFLKGLGRFDYYVDNDMLHDPVSFLGAAQVRDALEKCQSVLEENQLSTLDHKARQLTPISIRQLIQPDWAKAFSTIQEDSIAHD